MQLRQNWDKGEEIVDKFDTRPTNYITINFSRFPDFLRIQKDKSFDTDS